MHTAFGCYACQFAARARGNSAHVNDDQPFSSAFEDALWAAHHFFDLRGVWYHGYHHIRSNSNSAR